MPRFLGLTLLALFTALVLAARAQASSIVYLKGGNVFLTSPDGAVGYQVTFDGGWDAPSQADDGTLLAEHGTLLIRMDRSGRVLSSVPGLGGDTGVLPGDTFKLFGPFDPEISPDGRRIAYWATAYDPYSTSTTTYTEYRDTVIVTASDHLDVERRSWTTSVKTPSWIGSDHVLMNGSGVGAYAFQTWEAAQGDDAIQWWWTNVNAIEADSEVSRDGHHLVSVAQTNGALSASDTLHFFTVPGPAWTPPPYVNTWGSGAVRPPAPVPTCQNVRDSEVHSPSWAPDASAVAYDDKDGVWVQQLGDPATCTGMTERLVVPGATHPDWGPAGVDLAQRPAPPVGGGAPAPPATGALGPGAAAPSSPASAPAAAPAMRVTVPAHARRRAGIPVTVVLGRAGTVRITACRQVRGRCHGPAARRLVTAPAGTSRIVVAARRLRRGGVVVTVSGPGGPPVTRTTVLR